MACVATIKNSKVEGPFPITACHCSFLDQLNLIPSSLGFWCSKLLLINELLMVTAFSHSYKGGGIWPTQCQPRPFFSCFFLPFVWTHLPLTTTLPFHRYVFLGIDFKRFTLFPTIVVKNWTLTPNNLLRYASIHVTVAGGLTDLVCVCVYVCVYDYRKERMSQ